MIKTKIAGFIILLVCLFALVFLNLMIAGKNQFIMRFIDYRIGMEYRLLAPSFAWLWGTLLTIIVSCWIVRIRTINWMCKYEIERMSTISATRLTVRDCKIKELSQTVQSLNKEKQILLKSNQEAGIMIVQALNAMTNSGSYTFPIKKKKE